MPKNIVVFSDGTGQEGGRGHNTNVYKLFNMIEDRTEAQISFYDRGLGTGWRKLSGTIAGKGISKNIRECYEFIFEHYSSGDRIFLFGFSRGAATVRSLSGFVHLFGILPRSRPELIKRAYRIYEIGNCRERKRLACAFIRQHHTMWCKIKFLGVWDTVVALGVPFRSWNGFVDHLPWFRHRFHNFRLSQSVKHARHALAIDDERLIFHPRLWEEKLYEGQTVKQVWFCGMHTDVGGGYAEEGLSDIPLLWMVDEAVEHGLRIWPTHKVSLNPDPNCVMHDSRSGLLGRLFRRRVRSWDHTGRGAPTVHESVRMRRLGRDNSASTPYEPWILGMQPKVEPWPEHRRVKKQHGESHGREDNCTEA